MLTCLQADRAMAGATISAGIFMAKPHLHYCCHGAEIRFFCLLLPFAATRLDLKKVQGKEQNMYNTSEAYWLEAATDGKISIIQGVGDGGG